MLTIISIGLYIYEPGISITKAYLGNRRAKRCKYFANTRIIGHMKLNQHLVFYFCKLLRESWVLSGSFDKRKFLIQNCYRCKRYKTPLEIFAIEEL